MIIKDVFYRDDVFAHTARAILHGYRAKDKTVKESANPREINVVVIGPSEATATNYVEQALRAELPSNIVCTGTWIGDELTSNNIIINGHILVMPEVHYLRKELLYNLVYLINTCFEKSYGYSSSDLTVHYPNESLRDSVRGAMFEYWTHKFSRENHAVVPYRFKYEYNNCIEGGETPDWKAVKREAHLLTLSHMAPVITGKIGIIPCARNVFIDESMARVSYLRHVLNHVITTREGDAKVYIPRLVLETLFSQSVDAYKSIGDDRNCTDDSDLTIAEQRTVSQL